MLLILAILMSMTVPRFLDRGRRNLQLASDRVADLLTMYAQRESLGQKPVGLWHDDEQNWIVLLIVDDAGTADVPTGKWRQDTTVAPVKLPANVSLYEVRADHEPVDITSWPLTHTPGEDRPDIEIILSTDDDELIISLGPYSVAPHQYAPGEYAQSDRRPMDLDGSGLSREDW